MTDLHDPARRSAIVGGAALAAVSFSGRADDAIELKMATSWPKNSPGPGMTAQRLAERIATMSHGRLRIKVYAAGELIPALGVFDAVSGGAVDIGHTASFFWQGKLPAAAFFTAVPFGLTAGEHMAWLHHGGGQQAWEALYAPFGVMPFAAGNTGMGMGGWFRRPIDTLDDIKGLKYRMPGLGGEVFKRLGAVPVQVAPGEIYTALQTGVIDGAEFLGPWSDTAFGFYKIAKHYYWPGFHEPNGSAECLINADTFANLDADLQEVIANACGAENEYSLAETEWRNGESLEALVEQHDVEIKPFPVEVLNAAREHAEDVLATFAEGDAASKRVLDSFLTARERAIEWSRISRAAFLTARNRG